MPKMWSAIAGLALATAGALLLEFRSTGFYSVNLRTGQSTQIQSPIVLTAVGIVFLLSAIGINLPFLLSLVRLRTGH